MRSFLRYAQYRGEVATARAAAMPTVAAWTTTPTVPKAISPEHAQRAIDSCDLNTAIGLRDRAVLLLLARLGLRAHEVIALQLEDCDWDNGHLRLRSKMRREQLLPMPTDVGSATRLDLGRVHRVFYALSRQTGPRAPGMRNGPRLHDFRHRFAVQVLTRWYQSGEDPARRLPVLSTYLGHVRVAGTYWYLSNSPELMAQAMVRLERRWGGAL
jgi:integrase/recombinase XerD